MSLRAGHSQARVPYRRALCYWVASGKLVNIGVGIWFARVAGSSQPQQIFHGRLEAGLPEGGYEYAHDADQHLRGHAGAWPTGLGANGI